MNDLQSLAVSVGQLLQSRNMQLVTAESCTGGFLAKTITDIPGSSDWFERGYVVYSEAAKQECLGVGEATLSQFGAVSQETAEEMAQGALEHSHAQASIAITGIAGPDGGTDKKPVGLVWCSWVSKNWPIKSVCYQFKGDRAAVRRQTVLATLSVLGELLSQTE